MRTLLALSCLFWACDSGEADSTPTDAAPEEDGNVEDSSPPADAASPDVEVDAQPVDAALDLALDAAEETPDAEVDARPDLVEADLPQLDAAPDSSVVDAAPDAALDASADAEPDQGPDAIQEADAAPRECQLVETCNGEDDDCDGLEDETARCAVDRGCVDGRCRCAPGTIECVARCVDPLSHPRHCGGCGTICPGACVDGACAEACDEARTDCDGACVDLQSSAAHCGACGARCVAPNGELGCAEGECALVGCAPGWVDADEDPANGCECRPQAAEVCDGQDNDCDGAVDEDTDLLADLENCGACGRRCEGGEGSAVSCAGGQCAIIGDCEAGFHDLDGSGDNGCEYACRVVGAESCEGTDEDCDGAIDEDFDFQSDPEHCGGCEACDLPNASAQCVGGACVIGRCAPGFILGAGQVCVPGLPERLIHVDAAADPGGDGLVGTPFQRIAEGLAAAEQGDVVVVAPGRYAEQVVVGELITLRGADPARPPAVVGDGAGAPLHLIGEGARAFDLEVDAGGGPGVVLEGEGAELADARVLNFGAVAVDLTGDRAALRGVAIEGGTSAEDEPVVGVRVSASGARLERNTVSALQAAEREDAIGILLTGARDGLLLGNEVSDLRGGDAVGLGREGGAMALYFDRAEGNRVEHTLIGDLSAGAPGDQGGQEHGSGTYALYFAAPDSTDNYVGHSNRAEGRRLGFFRCDEGEGVVLEDLVLEGGIKSSNLAGVYVAGCDLVALRDLRLGDWIGRRSREDAPGVDARGVWIQDSRVVSLERVQLGSVRPGAPGRAGDQPGASAWGVQIEAGTVALDEISVGTVYAGLGHGFMVRHGRAAGVAITADAVEIHDLGVAAITRVAEDAVGLAVDAGGEVSLDRVRIFGARSRGARGVSLRSRGEAPARLSRLSIVGVEAQAPGEGLVLFASGLHLSGGAARVVDSIIAGGNDRGVFSELENPLLLDYSTVSGHPSNLVGDIELESVLAQDPRLGERLRPLPDSPVIDAGDPDSPCELEPFHWDGTCRADQGYFANTDLAGRRE